MTLDDLFLGAQAAIDRIIRRLRLGPPPVAGRRRLLIVQIDGLSRAVLEQALARGDMPVLRRLVGRDGHRLSPMTVGIPTSTPAFQMAAMYGVQPDIPGFHYHDKRRRTDIHFPRAGHAAFVEASQAANRPGILQGGSVYGCAFTGGAEHDFFSFARLTRPRMPGLLRVLSAFVLVAWVAAKCAALTATELVRTLGRIARRPRERAVRHGDGSRRRSACRCGRASGSRSRSRATSTTACRRSTSTTSTTTRGPTRSGPGAARPSRRFARSTDRSGRSGASLRRVPEYRYDLYVLADHGQASCTPYSAMTGGRRFERAFFDEILAGVAVPEPATFPPRPRRRLDHPAAAAVEAGNLDRRLATLAASTSASSPTSTSASRGSAMGSAWSRPGRMRSCTSWTRRSPCRSRRSRRAGLGCRPCSRRAPASASSWPAPRTAPSASGAAKAIASRSSTGGPFAEREDRAVVLRDLATLMAMPSAGDLVVYGIDAPEGHVSFIDEVGAHAGPSPEELHTFIVAPAEARRAGLDRSSAPALRSVHPLPVRDSLAVARLTAATTTPCRAHDTRTRYRARDRGVHRRFGLPCRTRVPFFRGLRAWHGTRTLNSA